MNSGEEDLSINVTTRKSTPPRVPWPDPAKPCRTATTTAVRIPRCCRDPGTCCSKKTVSGLGSMAWFSYLTCYSLAALCHRKTDLELSPPPDQKKAGDQALLFTRAPVDYQNRHWPLIQSPGHKMHWKLRANLTFSSTRGNTTAARWATPRPMCHPGQPQDGKYLSLPANSPASKQIQQISWTGHQSG